MNDENDKYFLFSVAVVLGLGLSFLAVFCGDYMMKKANGDIVLTIIISIVFVLLCILVLVISRYTKENSGNKEWCNYYMNDKVSKDTVQLYIGSDITELENFDLPKLTTIEFDSTKIAIKKDNFSKCRNIEVVKFYQRPNGVEKNTFSNCSNLKYVYLVGNSSDWKGFEIIVPMECEIKFLSQKVISIPEHKILQGMGNVIVNIQNSMSENSAKTNTSENKEENISE